jgi:hypothetical protein
VMWGLDLDRFSLPRLGWPRGGLCVGSMVLFCDHFIGFGVVCAGSVR